MVKSEVVFPAFDSMFADRTLGHFFAFSDHYGICDVNFKMRNGWSKEMRPYVPHDGHGFVLSVFLTMFYLIYYGKNAIQGTKAEWSRMAPLIFFSFMENIGSDINHFYGVQREMYLGTFILVVACSLFRSFYLRRCHESEFIRTNYFLIPVWFNDITVFLAIAFFFLDARDAVAVAEMGCLLSFPFYPKTWKGVTWNWLMETVFYWLISGAQIYEAKMLTCNRGFPRHAITDAVSFFYYFTRALRVDELLVEIPRQQELENLRRGKKTA